MKDKANQIYHKYIKGNTQNIILVICISGFIFGFFVGYLFIEGDRLNNEALQTSSEQNIKENTKKTNTENIETDVADKVIPSIVVVKNKVYVKKGGEKLLIDKGSGSGIVYKKNGYIITNQHVVKNADCISVRLHNGEEYDAKVIGEDSKTDLAVIKIEARNLTVGKFGDSDDIKVGQKAIAIGSPVGEEFSGTVTSGIISAVDRSIDMKNKRLKLIQTDAAINPGSSGGALLNSTGEIIGINSLKIANSQVEGMGFAIPINSSLIIADELLKIGYIKRPWLGLGLANSQEPQGVYVGDIAENGPADKSNIIRGDTIIKVNNNRVRNMVELSTIIEKYKPNEKIKITVYRNKEEQEIDFILGETSKFSPF